MQVIEGKHIFSFSKEHEYVERIKSGDIVKFIAQDCFDCQLNDENSTIGKLDWNHINSAIGPVLWKRRKREMY